LIRNIIKYIVGFYVFLGALSGFADPPRVGLIVFNSHGPFADAKPIISETIEDKIYDLLIYSEKNKTYYQLMPLSESNNTPIYVPVFGNDEKTKVKPRVDVNEKFHSAKFLPTEEGRLKLEIYTTTSTPTYSHSTQEFGKLIKYWTVTPFFEEFGEKQAYKNLVDTQEISRKFPQSINSCNSIYR
jgi:hypothetical protein